MQEILQSGLLTPAEIVDAGTGDSVNPERHWLGETEDVRKEQLQAAQESEEMTGLASRTGTVFLTPDEVRWIIRVADEAVKAHWRPSTA